jgi:hypothetical protein
MSVFDTDGNIQVILAYWVDGITTMARSRQPQDAGDVFPVIQSSLEWVSIAPRWTSTAQMQASTAHG